MRAGARHAAKPGPHVVGELNLCNRVAREVYILPPECKQPLRPRQRHLQVGGGKQQGDHEPSLPAAFAPLRGVCLQARNDPSAPSLQHHLIYLNLPEEIIYCKNLLKKNGILSIALPSDPGILWRIGRFLLTIFNLQIRLNVII